MKHHFQNLVKLVAIFAMGLILGVGIMRAIAHISADGFPVTGMAAPSPDIVKPLSDKTQQVIGIDGRPGPAVVNIWATWCAPCVKELPSLNRLANRSGVPVYAVSIDKNAQKAQMFLEDLAPDLQFIHDPEMAIVKTARAKGVPVTMFVDASGKVQALKTGEDEWDADEIVTYVQGMMSAH